MKTQLKFKEIAQSFSALLGACVLVALSLSLKAEDFKKTVEGNYDVDKGAVLVIQNKFGDVQCQVWDRNTVSITVTVTVDAGSQEKANKVFDKISVKLNGTRSKVEGITTVGSISNAEFSIDYDIRMPEWINLDLNNKFGDIILTENSGVARIDLEYGSMKANSFSGSNNQFTIKFSDVNAGFVQSGKVSIEYGKWKSEGVVDLTVHSRFSELKIEKSNTLNIDSQYDDVTIGTTGQIISVSRFTDLEFEKVTGDFDFDIEFGELAVDYIAPGFKRGKVRNSFAGVKLGFDPKANFNLDAEMKFGDLSYPKTQANISQETDGFTTSIYKGRIGTDANPSSSLAIISKNANTNISIVR